MLLLFGRTPAATENRSASLAKWTKSKPQPRKGSIKWKMKKKKKTEKRERTSRMKEKRRKKDRKRK